MIIGSGLRLNRGHFLSHGVDSLYRRGGSVVGCIVCGDSLQFLRHQGQSTFDD